MAWVLAAVFAIIAIGLLFKIMADASRVNEIREERDEAKKDARRMAEKIKDMDGKLSTKSAEAGVSKDQKKQVQEAEASKRAAEAAKKAAEDEKTRVEERNRELSAELQRVRIDKEQQRQELVAARERLRELGETAAQIEKLKAEKDDAVAAASRAAQRAVELAPAANPAEEAEREERQSTRLKKDLEVTRKSVERLEGALMMWKQKALESESNHRRLAKRFADSSLMWNITQSQLDLALDEIYTLQHGVPPEHLQTDKGRKRASLKPSEPAIEIKAGPVVVLPDARPSEGYRDETPDAPEPAKAEAAPAPVKAEPAKAEPAKAEAPKAEPAKAEAPKVEPAPAKAEPAKAEAPRAEEPKATKKAEPEQKPVLRKKEPEAPAADAKAEKKAPPRPKKGK